MNVEAYWTSWKARMPQSSNGTARLLPRIPSNSTTSSSALGGALVALASSARPELCSLSAPSIRMAYQQAPPCCTVHHASVSNSHLLGNASTGIYWGVRRHVSVFRCTHQASAPWSSAAVVEILRVALWDGSAGCWSSNGRTSPASSGDSSSASHSRPLSVPDERRTGGTGISQCIMHPPQ
jgi:hypothetical protein